MILLTTHQIVQSAKDTLKFVHSRYFGHTVLTLGCSTNSATFRIISIEKLPNGNYLHKLERILETA